MGTALLAVGIELLIGIILGLIITIIGLFFGNIIVFDSIALAVLAGFLAHGLLHIHPGFGDCDWGCDLAGIPFVAAHPPRFLDYRRIAFPSVGNHFFINGV